VAGIRAQRKAERPGEILEAAYQEFVLKGYAATRLEDVAARAGVTKGTIYFYFENKERVFEAMIDELSKAPIAAFQDTSVPWTGDLSGDVRGYLDRLYSFMAQNPRSREILRLLIAEASRFPELVDRHFDESLSRLIEPLRTRFADAVENGEMAQAPLSELPEVVLGPILALNVLMLLFANRRPLDPGRFMAAHRSLLLEGLLSEGSRRPATSGSFVGQVGHWTEWRRFPDPRRGELLTAPLAAGLYELRLGSGELILIAASRHVASQMSLLLPAEIKPIQRGTTSRRRFLLSHLSQLEYRVMSCATFDDARARAAEADLTSYMYRA
jgi:AcrR family transcriptional regulator